MKSPIRRIPFPIRLLLLSTLICSLTTCEIDTRISIADSKNPPTFDLSGNGRLLRFVVYGPFVKLEDMDLPSSTPGGRIIWEISRSADDRDPSFPQITYGTVPPRFIQLQPAAGTPPPLEERRFYAIGAPSMNAGFKRLCVTVDSGKVVKAPCHERE
jgi:hypothetical protein